MLNKDKVLGVLKNNSLCVLSTADLSGKSESAIMSLTIKDDLTIFMSTEESSRKAKNIKENSQVSITVGGFKDDSSLQIEGRAVFLENEEKTEAIKYMLLTNPILKEYGIESGAIIKITPTWVRYIDYSNESNKEEINL